MRGIRTLKIVTENLKGVGLSTLRRPAVKPDEPKTEELVGWGISMFAYSLIAHMQAILVGLVTLSESGNVAASAPVGRHIFEWTALSCYVTRKLKESLGKRDWEEAWALLTRVALGSYWAGKFGPKYAAAPAVKLLVEVPNPLRVGRTVEEYEKYQEERAKEVEANDNYNLLSDFSHPNAACLMRYQSWEDDGKVCRFIDPDAVPEPESFLPFVNCCLIDLLLFVYELLGMAGDTDVRPKVKFVLDELVKIAPVRLKISVPA